MLAYASKGAGPGPSTLAFRLSISLAARNVSRSPGCALQARQYPAGSVVPKFRPRPVTPYVKKPPPAPLVTRMVDSKAVIDILVQSCLKKDNKAVMNAWERIRKLDVIGEITNKQFSQLSDYIVGSFATPWTGDLFGQKKYVIYEDIAIQAAARDHWKGLYNLSIAALQHKRPADVANAFEKYKITIYKVQKKKRHNSMESDKATRTESRLEGYGPKPLSFVYLFAMMRMNQINGKVIMSVFETQRSIFGRSHFFIDDIMASVSPTLTSTEKVIVRRDFEKLIDTAIFVLGIWHPVALLRTMRDLDFNQDWAALRKLYNKFLDLSVGPNKLIHAYDLSESDHHGRYAEVPFTTSVWLRFIAYMKRSGDLAGLQDMLKVQMPARNLTLTPVVYRAFLIAFAYVARRPESTKAIREQAIESAENLWGEIVQRKVPINDNILSGRIESLSMYDPQSVPTLYDVISTGSYPQANSKTLTCLVNYFMRYGESEQALEIVRAGLEGRGICTPHKSAYTNLVKLAGIPQYEGERSRQLVLETLKIKPANIPLDPAAVGLVLAHLLSWGYTVDQVIERFRQSIIQSSVFNTIDCWEVAITSLLTRYQDRHVTTENEFHVSIRLLGLTRTEPPPNITHYTGQLLWSKIFRRIIASSLSSDTRANLLDLCVDAFPPAPVLQFAPDRFLAILEGALNRPKRDRIAEARGLFEWYTERSQIYRVEMRTVTLGYVQLCVRYAEFGLALNVIEDQPFSESAKRRARAIIERATRGAPASAALLDELSRALAGLGKSKNREIVVEQEPEPEPAEEDMRGRAGATLATETEETGEDLEVEDYM